PVPCTMFTTPAGRPASRHSSPSRTASNGVCSLGLSTTVLPAASAAPSFATIWCTGMFHGVIAPTTPRGTRTSSAPSIRSRQAVVRARPANDRSTAAGSSAWLALARAAGIPIWRVTSAARSAACSSSSAASRPSSSAPASGSLAPQDAAARAAASTALSTRARPPAPASPDAPAAQGAPTGTASPGAATQSPSVRHGPPPSQSSRRRPRSATVGHQPDGKALDAAEEVALQPLGLPADVDAQPALDQPLEEHPGLHAGQVRAEAGVHAPPEPDVVVGRAVVQEAVRGLEAPLVAVPGADPPDALLRRLDRLAVARDVAGRGAAHRQHGGHPAHHLLDGGGRAGRVGLERAPLLGLAGEADDAARE